MFSFISRIFNGNLGRKKAIIRRDDALLAVLGYKSQFRREFSLLESMAFSFSIMGVCAATSTTWYFPLVSGGHAGIVWGWIIPSLPVLCIAAALAELTSSMPTSAGLYYFSAKMAPRRYSPLLSWITGWANVFGQIALVCSIDFTCAQLIATGIAIGSDGKVVLGPGATFGIIIAILISHGIICCSATGILARLTLLFSCVNIGTTISATIALLVASGQKGTRVSARDAFTMFENHTGWRNNAWAFFLTFTSHAWCMTGYDGAAHISEEVSGAAKSAPIAIVAGVAVTEFLGLMYLISTSFAATSIEGLLQSELPLPIGQLYLDTLGKHGTLALWSCIIFVQWVNGVVQGVDASRVTFAFARDNGLPGSRWWKQINKRTQTPVNAVWLVMSVSALLSVLVFSSTALSSLAGATVVGLYTSYGMPILLRITSGRKVFQPGPFSLGRWWLPIGVVAVAWASFIVVLLMFPILAVTNANEMNYASAIVLAVFLWSSLSWIFSARHWFKGPIPNITDDDLKKYSDSDIVAKKFEEKVEIEVKEADDSFHS